MTHNTAIRNFQHLCSGLDAEAQKTHSIDPFADQNFVVAKNGASDDWSCVIM